MNIIILNGSPRKNGSTAKILHTMEHQLLQNKGVSVEFVDISNMKMSPCVGCCSCYKTGSCFINDDAETLSEKIGVADGVIIGSPTYASNVSGMLKQFIDRGHFVIEQLLNGKYTISVATGENYGSTDTSKALVKLLQYSGGKLTGKVICNIPFNGNPQNDAKRNRQFCDLANKLYVDIKKHKSYPIQTIFHNIIFNVGIKPFVKKKGEDYRGVLKKWEKNGVI